MTDLHPKIPGKYRRAFDWRVSHGNLHSLTTVQRRWFASHHRTFRASWRISWKSVEKRKGNWTALARLQMYLSEEVMLQEVAVRHYRKLLDFEKRWKPIAPDDQTSGRHSTRETGAVSSSLELLIIDEKLPTTRTDDRASFGTNYLGIAQSKDTGTPCRFAANGITSVPV